MKCEGIKNFLKAIWYKEKLPYPLWPLLPLSFIYAGLMQIRAACYRLGIFKIHPKPEKIPVIVVGNLSVGGTGKTPYVMHIVNLLKAHGYKPGIVSRGYKGNHHRYRCISNAYSFDVDSSYQDLQDVIWVDFKKSNSPNADPNYVGDEPLLLAKKLQCPVVVSKYRTKAVSVLAQSQQVDIIISDDGLQHYAMARDIEITLIDGLRRLGNGHCLPLGPLREMPCRLKKSDFVLVNLSEGGTPKDREYDMEYHILDSLASLIDFKQNLFFEKPKFTPGTLSQYTLTSERVHAVAGLAHPERFFKSLNAKGLQLITHAFPDHHSYSEADLNFEDDLPILMTEKDAIKCLHFANSTLGKKIWIVSMKARVNPLFDARLLLLIKEKIHG